MTNKSVVHNSDSMNFDFIKTNIKEGKYRFIGAGSGRKVYDLGNEYVVKFAKNKKGIAQNQIEAEISDIEPSDILAKVIKVSEDDSMLIMEKADRISNFQEILDYFQIEKKRDLMKNKDISQIIHRYSLITNDLVKTSSWGWIEHHAVIIDYGFTWKVRRKYY